MVPPRIAASAPILSREDRLQRARAILDEALGALDEADPYRQALAEILALVPLAVAAPSGVRRPLSIERLVRRYADRLVRLPGSPPSRREVIAARHAAQHAAAQSL